MNLLEMFKTLTQEEKKEFVYLIYEELNKQNQITSLGEEIGKYVHGTSLKVE